MPIVRKGKSRWVDEQQLVEWQRIEMQKAEEAPAKKAMKTRFVRGTTGGNDVPDVLR